MFRRFSAELIFISILLAVSVSTSDASALSISKCRELGFDYQTLPCSTCKRLATALGSSDEIVDQCRSCCSATLDWINDKRYDTAVLKTDQSGQSRWNGVNEFMERSAAKWQTAGLEIANLSPGDREPALHFRNDDDVDGEQDEDAGGDDTEDSGDVAGAGASRGRQAKKASGRSDRSRGGSGKGVSIPVGSWKIEHIEALLARKLKNTPESTAS